MKHLRKISAVLAVLTFAMTAFTACGGGATKETSVADNTPAVTEAPATDAPTEAETEAVPEEETVDPEIASLATELIDAVSNTVWVGMDAEYTCYVLAFSEDEIYFAADDDSELQGYWDISMDASHIYIYSDAEMTDEIGGFDWEYDEESDTMIIMDTVVMAQTEAETLEDAVTELEKMSLAKTVAEAMNGTYWIGEEADETYDVLYMEDDVMVWAYFDENAETNVATYYWGMDYDYITLYDADYNEVLQMGWDVTEDLSTLTLTVDGASVEMTQTDEASAEEVLGTMIQASDVVAAAAKDATDEEDGDYSSLLDGTLWAGVDEDGAAAGLIFDGSTATLASLDENGEFQTVDVEWAVDEENLTLGDAVYAWEMSDDLSILALQDEDGSIVSFEAVDGTEEDVATAMASFVS
ncbi:MAG: hypothetical protein V3G42_13670 [Oscillospiraceae bacterium]